MSVYSYRSPQAPQCFVDTGTTHRATATFPISSFSLRPPTSSPAPPNCFPRKQRTHHQIRRPIRHPPPRGRGAIKIPPTSRIPQLQLAGGFCVHACPTPRPVPVPVPDAAASASEAEAEEQGLAGLYVRTHVCQLISCACTAVIGKLVINSLASCSACLVRPLS